MVLAERKRNHDESRRSMARSGGNWYHLVGCVRNFGHFALDFGGCVLAGRTRNQLAVSHQQSHKCRARGWHSAHFHFHGSHFRGLLGRISAFRCGNRYFTNGVCEAGELVWVWGWHEFGYFGAQSMVFGLFGNVFFAEVLGLGLSILSGGLTLACMVLPILIRATQQGLRSVPNEYRQAAAALGISRLAVLWRVLLAAAMPGIAAGLLLGIGRAIAETAALIFTSGYVTRMPDSLFDSGRALSVHIYDLALNVPGGEANAYATALVLVIFILLLNAAVFALAVKFRRSWLSG